MARLDSKKSSDVVSEKDEVLGPVIVGLGALLIIAIMVGLVFLLFNR
jgi:hypothetical protein